MSKNSVVHFEMPYEDGKRMAEFYTKVFGWQTNQLGPEMGNYIIAQTTETDQNNMVKTPGTINGGFAAKGANNQSPSVVISVDDIKVAIEKVKEAGGKVLGGGNPNKKSPEEPDDIPGVGLYVAFEDTEGNRVGMLQPKGM